MIVLIGGEAEAVSGDWLDAHQARPLVDYSEIGCRSRLPYGLRSKSQNKLLS